MDVPIELSDIVKKYLTVFPDEATALEGFPDYASVRDNPDVIKGYLGYTTASAFVIAKQTRQVLLFENGPLQFFLRPSEHIGQVDQTIVSAFRRELQEEIGFADYQDVSLFKEESRIPLDIEVQTIQETDQKRNAPHAYYNFRYVFLIDAREDSEKKLDAASAYEWVDWEVFKKLSSAFARIATKTENLHIFS